MGALLAICLGLFALAWRASNAAMEFPPAHYPWTIANYPALERSAVPFTIHSSTGVTLAARFFRGTEGATIVLSHGYGADQDEMLPVANTLHAAGFNVVTYDERGRAQSGGTGTLGALETKDLRSVIGVVARHQYVDPQEIGEFGFSIGAAVTIMEAANDRRVKAVVEVAGWAKLTDWTKPKLSNTLLRPTWMFSPLALKVLELRTGANLGPLHPAAVIGRISPRPILIIHGLDDTDQLPRESEINYAHAGAPKTLWLVPGETHEGTVFPGGAATTPRVAQFFERALLPAHS